MPVFFGPWKVVKLADELLSAMIAADPSVRVPSRGESPGSYDELVSMKSALAIRLAQLKYYHCHLSSEVAGSKTIKICECYREPPGEGEIDFIDED